MKLFLSFLIFAAVFQLCTSKVLSKREILSSDATAVQNESDVIMAKPGHLEVVLNNASELIFEVCSMKCTADFFVCYEPDSSGQNVLESCDTKCGFNVTTLGNKISFMKSITSAYGAYNGNKKSNQCFEAKMVNGLTKVLALNHEVAKATTCAPKIENGIVKLNIINATSDCVVSIKNAIIKTETTTTPPPTTTTIGQLDLTSSGENGYAAATTTDEPESFMANYW
uniref:Chondroitin proteoglycan 4 domain-containing protein n=1 Tax=Panagrolaimus sp. PS1159 TaxID=55785 RepID=A0AC35F4F2_9BILA